MRALGRGAQFGIGVAMLATGSGGLWLAGRWVFTSGPSALSTTIGIVLVTMLVGGVMLVLIGAGEVTQRVREIVMLLPFAAVNWVLQWNRNRRSRSRGE